jgi:hypothetical protein
MHFLTRAPPVVTYGRYLALFLAFRRQLESPRAADRAGQQTQIRSEVGCGSTPRHVRSWAWSKGAEPASRLVLRASGLDLGRSGRGGRRGAGVALAIRRYSIELGLERNYRQALGL